MQTKMFEKFIIRIEIAGNVVNDIMLDKEAPHNVRLRAADLALKYGTSAIQDLTMARDIQNIEKRLDERDKLENFE